MFDSVLAVPVHFTIEFLAFLVLAGAALLVFTRPALIPAQASERAVVGAGFLTVAAMEVLHGGAFATSDANRVLLAGQALGFTLVLIGVSGRLGRRAPQGAAFTVPAVFHAPLALVPGAAALGAALVAGAGALRAGPRSLGRLSAALLLFALSAVLTAVAGPAEVGVSRVQPWLYASHGAKLAASLLLVWWLWAAVVSSVRTRFVVAFAALLVIVVLFLSSALTGVISNNLEADQLSRVSSQLTNVRRTIEGRSNTSATSEINQAAALVAGLRPVRADLRTRSRLRSIARQVVGSEVVRVDFVIFTTPEGRLLAFAGHGPVAGSASKPPPLGGIQVLRLKGSRLIDTVASRQDAAASVVAAGNSIAVMAARRVAPPGPGRGVAGIVATGRWIDGLTMASISQNVASAEASLLVDEKVVATSLPGDPREIASGDARSAVRAGRRTTSVGTISHHSYFSAFAPLRDAGGVPVATLALSSPASVVAATRESVIRILFLVAMCIAAVALLLAWYSGRRITRPIQQLTAAAGAVRGGDLSARAAVGGTDEVGRLGESFNEMTASLARMTGDLKQAARQEHDLRTRIETIIRSMADGLVAVDRDRNVLAFNREMEALTGTPAGDAVGRRIDEVLRVRDGEGNEVAVDLMAVPATPLGGVFLDRPAGPPVPVAITTAVLRDEGGEVSGGVAVVRDMTREREVERMKTEFLSNISHELRTPLTPIKGFAQILGAGDVPADKAREFARGIAESTDRLERIVELLVDFAALEAGRLEPRTADVDVGELVRDLARRWDGRAPRHEVVAELPPGLPPAVGDARLLRRSLEEVLDNAVKFSPDGGRISLEARATTGNGAATMVEVVVVDEGIGIDPDDLPRIFSEFRQLDGSATRTYGGMGLGLAFVHRIVEAHDGRVGVESEPGRGTRFTISLPASTHAGASKPPPPPVRPGS